jgi:hypothetical protein
MDEKLGGTEFVKIQRRHPALILLKILLDGHPVVVDEETYYYLNGVFGVKRERHDTKTGETEEVVLGVEMDIANFIKWCERLPETTVIQAVFNATLKGMQRPRP